MKESVGGEKKHIILIGMPGSGKTTMGRKLSALLHLPFLDLDEEIENGFGKSVPDLFREHGEEVFRKLEHEFLKKIVAENKAFVLSTGGGTPCFFDNMKILLQHGMVVFLNPSLTQIERRLGKDADRSRPVLSGFGDLQSKLRFMLEERITFYQQAHFTFAGDSEEELIELLRQRS